MYSEMVDRLGLSQGAMEALVFMGIIVAIIGVVLVLYWKYIVVGALAVACLTVMANHKPTINNSPEKKEEFIIPPETPKVETPKSKDEEQDVRKQFMDKCINLADYTRTHCEELWDDRVKEERVSLDINEERTHNDN